MGYLKYKGYTGSVEYSEDDKCLFGKVQGMSKAVADRDRSTSGRLQGKNSFYLLLNSNLRKLN